jgi:hypothetical protein
MHRRVANRIVFAALASSFSVITFKPSGFLIPLCILLEDVLKKTPSSIRIGEARNPISLIPPRQRGRTTRGFNTQPATCGPLSTSNLRKSSPATQVNVWSAPYVLFLSPISTAPGQEQQRALLDRRGLRSPRLDPRISNGNHFNTDSDLRNKHHVARARSGSGTSRASKRCLPVQSRNARNLRVISTCNGVRFCGNT